MIQVLLNEGDYVGALELIEYAGKYLRGQNASLLESGGTEQSSTATSKPPKELGPGVKLQDVQTVLSQKIDLKGVKSLGTLSTQLVEVSRTIYSVMEADLISILMKDLSETVSTPISIPSSKDKTQNFVSSKLSKAPVTTWIKKILENQYTPQAAPNLMLPTDGLLAQDEALRTKLLPVVLGLLRINKLDDAMSAYKDHLLAEIKILTKKVIFPFYFCAQCICKSNL
jgi:hypothetical protein